MERRGIETGHGTAETMFLAWLLALPEDMTVERAARAEIARIDAVEAPSAHLLSMKRQLEQATARISHPTRRRVTRRH